MWCVQSTQNVSHSAYGKYTASQGRTGCVFLFVKYALKAHVRTAPRQYGVQYPGRYGRSGLRIAASVLHSMFDELASATHDTINYSAYARYDAFISEKYNSVVRYPASSLPFPGQVASGCSAPAPPGQGEVHHRLHRPDRDGVHVLRDGQGIRHRLRQQRDRVALREDHGVLRCRDQLRGEVLCEEYPAAASCQGGISPTALLGDVLNPLLER